MAGTKGTGARAKSRGGDTRQWPYHRNDHTGEMVKCANNPCSLHSDENGNPTDILASSPEEATRLYYEREGSDSVGMSAPASTNLSGAERLLMGIPGPDRSKPGTPEAEAFAQLKALAADSKISADVLADYAGWLGKNVVDAVAETGRVRGYDDDMISMHDIVATRPAEFVLDGDEPGTGADDRDLRSMSPVAPMSMAEDGSGYAREDSSFLLRDFGRGQARSRKALRVLTGPAPSSGLPVGAGTDGKAFSNSGDIVYAIPDSKRPSGKSAKRWIDTATRDDRNTLVTAALHPWGGQALQGSYMAGPYTMPGHELGFDGGAVREVRRRATEAAATDGMAEMLTAADYEAVDPGQLHDMFVAMRPGEARVGDVTKESVRRAMLSYDDPEGPFLTSSGHANVMIRELHPEAPSARHTSPDVKTSQVLAVRATAAAHDLGCEPWQVVNALEHSRRKGDGALDDFLRARPKDMAAVIRDDVKKTWFGPFYGDDLAE